MIKETEKIKKENYSNLENNTKKSKIKKNKIKHFNLGRGMVRIVALLLVLIMVLATAWTLVYYLLVM